MVLKIWIESLKKRCEGVSFFLNFRLEACKFTRNKFLHRHDVSNLGNGGNLDIF